MEDSQDITTKLRMSQQELSYRLHVITLKSNQAVTSTGQPVCHNYSPINIHHTSRVQSGCHNQNTGRIAQLEHSQGLTSSDPVTVSQLKDKPPLTRHQRIAACRTAPSQRPGPSSSPPLQRCALPSPSSGPSVDNRPGRKHRYRLPLQRKLYPQTAEVSTLGRDFREGLHALHHDLLKKQQS